MNKAAYRTNLIFFGFAILWGAAFPITKEALSYIHPVLFVFLRFGLASLFLLPLIMSNLKEAKLDQIKFGLILGILNTAIYLFETTSLQYTSAPRCAFIMGINVILVPFMAHVFQISKISIVDVVSALICLIGLYVLTGSHIHNINMGDILAICGAISIALSITYVQQISGYTINYTFLTFYQLIFTCPIPLAIYSSLYTSIHVNLTESAIFAVIFCAIFATAIPLLGQMKLQKNTTAIQTALIFSLEPVFASIVDCLFYNHSISQNIIIGGSLMLVSTIVPIILTPILLRIS